MPDAADDVRPGTSRARLEPIKKQLTGWVARSPSTSMMKSVVRWYEAGKPDSAPVRIIAMSASAPDTTLPA